MESFPNHYFKKEVIIFNFNCFIGDLITANYFIYFQN